jgi:hypothetical protein
MRDKISCYIHYSEYDYGFNRPILVIQGEFRSTGYNVDPDTGELERVCICHAWNERECLCGAWDERADEEDYA